MTLYLLLRKKILLEQTEEKISEYDYRSLKDLDNNRQSGFTV